MTTTAEQHPATSGQGAVLDLQNVAAADRLRAFDDAFDYRGDVTLTLGDGSRVECFVFDRRPGPSLAESFVRVMVAADGARRSIPYDRIVRLEFSGKDTAAGKTWENWVRRYVEKRLAGERASIEAEPLD
jgi:hypothetical protein